MSNFLSQMALSSRILHIFATKMHSNQSRTSDDNNKDWQNNHLQNYNETCLGTCIFFNLVILSDVHYRSILKGQKNRKSGELSKSRVQMAENKNTCTEPKNCHLASWKTHSLKVSLIVFEYLKTKQKTTGKGMWNYLDTRQASALRHLETDPD